MIKDILKQIGILIVIIIAILLVTFLVSDKDIYKDIYVIDITLSRETDISKLEEDTRRVFEDNTIRVKQVINFLDRDAKTKEVKLIPKENLLLNIDIYMMNLFAVILVTGLCTVMLKVITKRLEEN